MGKTCASTLALSAPFPVQYLALMSRYGRGDLGVMDSGQSVRSAIVSATPSSLALIGCSIALYLLVTVLGKVIVRGQGSIGHLLAAAPLSALPGIWVGLLSVYFLSYRWAVLPATHAQSVAIPAVGSRLWLSTLTASPLTLLEDATRHFALPVVALTFVAFAAQAQVWDGTAGSGFDSPAGALAHLLRSFPALLGGLAPVETLFRWNGLGALFVTSLRGGDYALGLGILLASSVCGATLLALADGIEPKIDTGKMFSTPSRRGARYGFGTLLVIACFVAVVPLLPSGPIDLGGLGGSNAPPRLALPGSPAWFYLLGTDSTGHSVLMWVTYGGRLALALAIASALLAIVIARLDALPRRVTAIQIVLDALNSTFRATPYLLLLAVLQSFISANRTWLVVVLAGTAAGLVVSRQRHNGWTLRTLPHVVASLLLIQSAVDFLGVGVRAPLVTWGAGLANSTDYMAWGNWWWWFFPGLFLAVAAISLRACPGPSG
ncbi:MAG: ABC transporter permease subunit [Chloroflexota bacterium]|nr:MAG: hypothetical protein DLM70_02315 [Chloroflexota bacterium]